ncbi:crystal et79 [Fusarium circinatum]|uniref:Crystal et79 n=1 Tax=Fusarium circinatum TaxID=48490 RepID=A0A8H5UCU9_FUSCI|nr:crystal et79 [Fusarium circinatum]
MRAESDGIMSGDEGYVIYTSAAGDLTFNFDNPYVGDNSYHPSVPDQFNVSSSGGDGNNCIIPIQSPVSASCGDGNNCIITYTITEKLGHGHK